MNLLIVYAHASVGEAAVQDYINAVVKTLTFQDSAGRDDFDFERDSGTGRFVARKKASGCLGVTMVGVFGVIVGLAWLFN